ncbi:Peptidase M48 Ste24p [Candidatus Zixiibacteriota bacterium]|nr:Peptidase M48 Ste24p [candidate division Zixibacteria bacterium]
MKFPSIVRLLPFALIIILAGCAVTGPGGKTSLIFIGTDQEVAIGDEMDSSIQAENRILKDTLWQQYVNTIGQKIVAGCDRKDLTYHFAIIDTNLVNAFATPGGYVFLYTGLLKQMDNEAELAAVMAHEISHVVARHGIKRLQAAMGVSILEQLVFGNDPGALKAAVNVGMGLTFASYSRENENEADSYGIQYMIKAGYDPSGAITMFEKLAAMSQGDPNFFEKLSMDHPETQDRISKSKALIESLKPLPANLNTYTQKYRIMRSRLR